MVLLIGSHPYRVATLPTDEEIRAYRFASVSCWHYDQTARNFTVADDTV